MFVELGSWSTCVTGRWAAGTCPGHITFRDRGARTYDPMFFDHLGPDGDADTLLIV